MENTLFTKRRINALQKKGIENLFQLRRWFPIRYIDNTKAYYLSPAFHNSHITAIGTLIKCECKDMSSRAGTFVIAYLIEKNTNTKFKAIFFGGGNYLLRKLNHLIGENILVAGTLKYHEIYGYSISNIDEFTKEINENMIIKPVFSKIKNISDEVLVEMLKTSVSSKETETLPEDIMQKYQLMGINDAISEIMFPTNFNNLKEANRRIDFDDLFYLGSKFLLSDLEESTNEYHFISSDLTDSIIKELPFQLTNDQYQTYLKIKDTVMNNKHLKALIQGDVSCGKTIVSFLAMLLAAENGYQACLMAPTKILATQHYEKLKDLIKNTDLECLLLAGDKLNKEDLKKIKEGKVKLLVGTHQLTSDKIEFHNLAMVIIDEEHRFGVIQRNKLKETGANYISMSATPIPSTLASAVYGKKTEIFSIKQMPNGRKPVMTSWSASLQNSFASIQYALNNKEQVYIVCPLIEEAEKDSIMSHVLSTDETLNILKAQFPTYNIAQLNGKMKQEDIDRALNDFKLGRVDILISTTIIEVGVDVPNATLMIIQNAERFGLAAMHQLRGRVGRGQKQSYCILVSEHSPAENDRLLTLCNVSDGFEISYKDMTTLRQAGSIFHLKQSGYNKFIAKMLENESLYQSILEDIKNIDIKILKSHVNKLEQ